MKDQVETIQKLRMNFHTSNTGGKRDVINIYHRESSPNQAIELFLRPQDQEICDVKFFQSESTGDLRNGFTQYQLLKRIKLTFISHIYIRKTLKSLFYEDLNSPSQIHSEPKIFVHKKKSKRVDFFFYHIFSKEAENNIKKKCDKIPLKY